MLKPRTDVKTSNSCLAWHVLYHGSVLKRIGTYYHGELLRRRAPSLPGSENCLWSRLTKLRKMSLWTPLCMHWARSGHVSYRNQILPNE